MAVFSEGSLKNILFNLCRKTGFDLTLNLKVLLNEK